jgi:hypothetical protein
LKFSNQIRSFYKILSEDFFVLLFNLFFFSHFDKSTTKNKNNNLFPLKTRSKICNAFQFQLIKASIKSLGDFCKEHDSINNTPAINGDSTSFWPTHLRTKGKRAKKHTFHP